MTNNFRAQLVHLHLGPTTFTLALHGLTSSYACSTNFLCPWLTAPFTSRSYTVLAHELERKCQRAAKLRRRRPCGLRGLPPMLTVFTLSFATPSHIAARTNHAGASASSTQNSQNNCSWMSRFRWPIARLLIPATHPEEHPHGLLFFPQQRCKHVHLHVLQEVVDTANYLSRGWV